MYLKQERRVGELKKASTGAKCQSAKRWTNELKINEENEETEK